MAPRPRRTQDWRPVFETPSGPFSHTFIFPREMEALTPQPSPHGGHLVQRHATDSQRAAMAREWPGLPRITLTPEERHVVAGIANGAYSPLRGFLTRADYESVLKEGRLASGVPWTIPTVLHVPADAPFHEGDRVALAAPDGSPFAVLDVRDLYRFPREAHCRAVFGTTDERHPGVARARAAKPVLAGGEVTVFEEGLAAFPGLTPTPAETRALFRERGWRTVAGYQTRNPPHRAHEFLHKLVLGLVDGLYVNPVVGRKKPGDFRDEVIVDAYHAVLSNYYPRERVHFGVLHYEMQYAGPREAIHHAILRKNHGCTHFIVGRDHAGVGSFYGPEDAILKFDEYPDLGIQPLAVRGDHFWCRLCGGLESERTCPHPAASRIEFSGTLVRSIVQGGAEPPAEVMRPEVAWAIRKHEKPFHE